eukprot:TRINITY_DN23350_c0_g1_i1.p1 TRINITY_DN23350_c0_g1~~TRINITY_DN23350_c0_g1_i1.p1  ORF type:complete len:185 (-),score=23.22 TRINITY_DN23350_c0_g1_i1:190-744(-)
MFGKCCCSKDDLEQTQLAFSAPVCQDESVSVTGLSLEQIQSNLVEKRSTPTPAESSVTSPANAESPDSRMRAASPDSRMSGGESTSPEDNGERKVFEAVLRKPDSQTKVGLRVKKKKAYLRIGRVSNDGLAQLYNVLAEKEGRPVLATNQRIVDVNGITGDDVAMLDALERFDGELRLKVEYST